MTHKKQLQINHSEFSKLETGLSLKFPTRQNYRRSQNDLPLKSTFTLSFKLSFYEPENREIFIGMKF